MIGIFGGTFDPVHYGHIKPALSIKQALNLSQLRFIPNRNPPHREQPWLDVARRVALLKMALADLPDVVVDEREVARDGPSYMVDTLQTLVSDFPDDDFCLIIGMDAYMAIAKWFRWRSLFELCHLVVTTRPGFATEQVSARMSAADYQFLSERLVSEAAQLRPRETGKILLKSVPQLAISSTQIRDRLRRGEDVSEWLPVAVSEQLRGFQ